MVHSGPPKSKRIRRDSAMGGHLIYAPNQDYSVSEMIFLLSQSCRFLPDKIGGPGAVVGILLTQAGGTKR